MFTWICPTCGREVPPSYSECPDCAAKASAAAPPAPDAAQAPPPAGPVAPAPPAAPPAPVAPVAPAAPMPRPGMPTWLLAIVFTFAFVGLVGGIYWMVAHFSGGSQTAANVPAAPPPTPATAKQDELQKYIEVSGIRFMETPKHETEARFVVTNHSGADISGLTGSVNIWGRTDRSEEEAAGSFSFKLDSLGAYASKEATAPVKTKLKVYELPDWQNVSAEVQVTSP